MDASLRINEYFNFYGALAYTDAKYETFTNAPLPLEEVGSSIDGEQLAFKDIFGARLPGVFKWAGSFGAEIASNDIAFLSETGKLYFAVDSYFRSEFSSSSSPSQYLNVDGYGLLNARLGFRATEGLSINIWGRNVLDTDYFEQLLPAGGSAGHYAAVLGDPRTYGTTLRYTF